MLLNIISQYIKIRMIKTALIKFKWSTRPNKRVAEIVKTNSQIKTKSGAI